MSVEVGPSSRLGVWLQAVAAVPAAAVDKALQEQRTQQAQGKIPERLGALLVRMGVVTPLQVLQALGRQFDLPVQTTLALDQIDVTLCQKIPIAFAKQHGLLLCSWDAVTQYVRVACSDPTAVHALDEVRRQLDAELEIFLTPEDLLLETINKVYSQGRAAADLASDAGDKDTTEEESEENVDLVDLSDEAPIIRWVNSVIFYAVRMHASDIHLEPREKDLIVRFRIDGVLEEYKRAPKQFINAILARVKIMAGLNIAEKRLPQDGRIRRKIAGKDIDMRVATAPTNFGERITIRLLDRSSVLLDLADLGFGSDHLAAILELIDRPHGILLVTGPTGSGKTTTLYGALSKINRADINILTVEDPVEYQLEGISQIQVNPKIELTFASAIRSFLRHDPDVIMVGEIRDQETASMAITASLTGHLVFSTIHTNDAAGAVARLIDMGIEPFLVTSSLSAVLAQRLIRRLCFQCRESYVPTEEELRQLGLSPAAFFAGRLPSVVYKSKASPPAPGTLFRQNKAGCDACNHLGYSGRSAIYELLIVSDEIRALALKKSDAGTIKKEAVTQGMRTLRLDGAYKVLAGLTSTAEVMMATAEDSE